MTLSNSKDPSGKDVDNLWERLRNGERKALDLLFRRFYDELFAYAYKIVPDEDLVKDSIQELFLELWRTKDRINKATSVNAYLLVSIRRIVLRSLEKERNRYKRNLTFVENLFEKDFTLNQLEIEEGEDESKKKEILRVLNRLNAKQKETIYLRYYHGLSNAEIAEVMDINYQSVKNNLSRAIKSLRVIVKSSADMMFLISLIKQISA